MAAGVPAGTGLAPDDAMAPVPRLSALLPTILSAVLSASGPAGASPGPGIAVPGPSPGQMCRAAIRAAERDAGLPGALLQAIGRVESGRRDPEGGFAPWPWTLNAEGRGSFFPSKEAAIAGVRALQARGVRVIDVGCMQINLHHHPAAFAGLEEAFDPLANARYAARFLSQLNASRQDWLVSAGNYHSGTPERAAGYRAKVALAWDDERRQAGLRPVSPAADAALLAARPSPPALPHPGRAQVVAMAPGASPPMLPRVFGGMGAGGGQGLSNGAERAQVVAMPSGGGGRGLDAYRAQPIALASRLPTVFQVAGMGR